MLFFSAVFGGKYLGSSGNDRASFELLLTDERRKEREKGGGRVLGFAHLSFLGKVNLCP